MSVVVSLVANSTTLENLTVRIFLTAAEHTSTVETWPRRTHIYHKDIYFTLPLEHYSPYGIAVLESLKTLEHL